MKIDGKPLEQFRPQFLPKGDHQQSVRRRFFEGVKDFRSVDIFDFQQARRIGTKVFDLCGNRSRCCRSTATCWAIRLTHDKGNLKPFAHRAQRRKPKGP